MLRNVTFLVGLQAAVDFSMCQQLYQPSLLWHGWEKEDFLEKVLRQKKEAGFDKEDNSNF